MTARCGRGLRPELLPKKPPVFFLPLSHRERPAPSVQALQRDGGGGPHRGAGCCALAHAALQRCGGARNRVRSRARPRPGCASAPLRRRSRLFPPPRPVPGYRSRYGLFLRGPGGILLRSFALGRVQAHPDHPAAGHQGKGGGTLGCAAGEPPGPGPSL